MQFLILMLVIVGGMIGLVLSLAFILMPFAVIYIAILLHVVIRNQKRDTD